MSDEENLNFENKVVFTMEDAKHLEDFYNHFKIPIPPYLQAQLDEFKKDPVNYTVEQQRRLRQEIAHAIASSDHELLKDHLFKNVISNCSKEWYETQFERDVEDILASDE